MLGLFRVLLDEDTALTHQLTVIQIKVSLVTYVRFREPYVKQIVLINVFWTEFSGVDLNFIKQAQLLEGSCDEFTACEGSLHALTLVEPTILLWIGNHILN